MRTHDDTMITVKLMLFYELKDVTKMVSASSLIAKIDICLITEHVDLINFCCYFIFNFFPYKSDVLFFVSETVIYAYENYSTVNTSCRTVALWKNFC